MSFGILGFDDVGDIFEPRHYILASVGPDIFALGPFDTWQLCMENLRRMLEADDQKPDGAPDMLDHVHFLGIAKYTGIDLVRHGINKIDGKVFADKLPWEDK